MVIAQGGERHGMAASVRLRMAGDKAFVDGSTADGVADPGSGASGAEVSLGSGGADPPSNPPPPWVTRQISGRGRAAADGGRPGTQKELPKKSRKTVH